MRICQFLINNVPISRRSFSTMVFNLPDLNHDFSIIELKFTGKLYEDVFGLKNNKTVAETLQHRRYRQLSTVVKERNPNILNEPLGTALLRLKHDGDKIYKRFLNPYGDLRYSTFSLATSEFESATGVYAYFNGNILRYIGRCRDSMKKRVNQGYGKIHPKNCYLDGQATNCRLNALISKTSEAISLRMCRIEGSSEIEHVESSLIQRHKPYWNI